MNKKRYLIILASLIFSTMYLLCIGLYDQKKEKIEHIFNAVNKEEINYKEVGVKLEGIKENEKLTLKSLFNKQDKVVEAFSHSSNCSRLCRQQHINSDKRHIEPVGNDLISTSEGVKGDTSYQVTIKNKKGNHYNTHYTIEIQGLNNLTSIDEYYERAAVFLNDMGAKYRETIYIKGEVTGHLSKEKRSQYKNQIFEALKVKEKGRYQDDINQDVEAYYGYTPIEKEFVLDDNGSKNNIQLSFSYDELKNKTNIIIAFPFYNEPF